MIFKGGEIKSSVLLCLLVGCEMVVLWGWWGGGVGGLLPHSLCTIMLDCLQKMIDPLILHVNYLRYPGRKHLYQCHIDLDNIILLRV